MATLEWNKFENHYDYKSDIETEEITAVVNKESVTLYNCPWCGKYHDRKAVANVESDVSGLCVFCCEECRNQALEEFGAFCKGCNSFIPAWEGMDPEYPQYCTQCADEEREEDDEWESEKNFMSKPIL